MADYIDREKLLAKIDEAFFETDPDGKEQIGVLKCRAIIPEIPAADVAPVVHGWWEWFDEETGTPLTGHEREWGWRCSSCKQELPDDYDNPDYRPMLSYCPDCGARMDGDAE